MRLNRWTKIGLACSALSVLLGTGLLALTADSVTSEDNTLGSRSFGTAHDLQIAEPGTVGDPMFGQVPTCDLESNLPNHTPPNYSDGPIGAVISGFLSSTETESTDVLEFCVLNAGGEDAAITVSFSGVSESEIFADGSLDGCTAAEKSTGGDTSCTGARADGELSHVVLIGATGCGLEGVFDPGLPFADFVGAGVQGDIALPAGASCELEFRYALDPASSAADRARAETDRITWDIVVTGSDPA